MFKKNVFDVNHESRYTVTKTSKATYKKKTDCNGKSYYNVEFYCVTKKGNKVLFNERRLNENDAKKKCFALNTYTQEIKVRVGCAEEVTFDNDVEKRLLYGHALTADLAIL